MLTDFVISPSLRYEAHALIYATDPQSDPLRIEGALGATLLCALLTDTDEGDRRGIALDTDADRRAWITRYEREVRRDDWGTLETELRLLANAWIELTTSSVALTDICPNSRLLDLALRLLCTYMHHLVIEVFGMHIWECVPWQAPFAEWLIRAAHVETQRQRYLHIDWTDPVEVTALAETATNDQRLTTNDQLSPTLVFEGEAAEEIMARYLEWLWKTYRAQVREIPGAKPDTASHRNYIVEQETDWSFLADEIGTLPDDLQRLWAEWLLNWQHFVTRRLKPQRPVRFWTEGVSEKQQAQLTQFLRIQEKEWDYYKCLAASVYALRQLGYVRRACSITDITRWLAEQLVNNYTEKNRRDQFRKAWNELGRYSDDVRHFVSLLASYGISSL